MVKDMTAKQKTKEQVVAESLEKIKAVVAGVKKNSLSDFESLKREIELMLTQPEKL